MNKRIFQIENMSAEDFLKHFTDFKSTLKDLILSVNSKDDDKLLSRQETADLLRISLVTLWEWTRKDLIPAYRIGGKVRYKKSEVLQALNQMNNFKNK